MVTLSLTFFNAIKIRIDNKISNKFRSAKVQGLLVYLVLNAQRVHSREQLAVLFWPDESDTVSKKNLRQSLYQLRLVLGDAAASNGGFLQIDRHSVQFNLAAPFQVDVLQFLDSIAEGNLQTAVSIYTGELLPGFTCDSLEFESWLRLERERLHRLALEAMADLTERQIAQNDLVAAQATARRQLHFEPWREVAHRQLMRVLGLSGDRSAALAQFQQCQDVLDEELGITPEPETVALAEQIERNELVAAAPDLIAGRYRLGQQIGQGAMGIVSRGMDEQTRQPVAIKMLDRSRVANQPELIERFRREGEALDRLHHPNIVHFLAADEKDGRIYLIMEYVAGGSLRELLDAQGPLPLPQVLKIGLDLTDALTRSHRLNILHRDVKPANVLLDADGHPRLADFGVARLGENSELTQTGAVIGTYAYMSPEACLGEPLDQRADIWSLGVLLYELLTGQRPFAGPTSATTLMAILQSPLPDITTARPDLPHELRKLIERMLAKPKERRIASMRLVGVTLEAVLRGKEVPIVVEIPANREAASAAAEPAGSTQTAAPVMALRPFQAPAIPTHFVCGSGRPD